MTATYDEIRQRFVEAQAKLDAISRTIRYWGDGDHARIIRAIIDGHAV